MLLLRKYLSKNIFVTNVLIGWERIKKLQSDITLLVIKQHYQGLYDE